MNFVRLSHDRVAFWCWSRRFDCNTASPHQAMMSIVSVIVAIVYLLWPACFQEYEDSMSCVLVFVVVKPREYVVGRFLFLPKKRGTTGILWRIIFACCTSFSSGYEGGSISKVLSLIQKSSVVSLDRYSWICYAYSQINRMVRGCLFFKLNFERQLRFASKWTFALFFFVCSESPAWLFVKTRLS